MAVAAVVQHGLVDARDLPVFCMRVLDEGCFHGAGRKNILTLVPVQIDVENAVPKLDFVFLSIQIDLDFILSFVVAKSDHQAPRAIYDEPVGGMHQDCLAKTYGRSDQNRQDK
jgi:hypothetical protein